MRKSISLFILLLFTLTISARKPKVVEVHDTVYVEVIKNEFDIVGDTLYLRGDANELSRYLTIIHEEDTLFYKNLVPDTVFAMDGVPASDMYSDIWMNTRVNPYNTPIDSIKNPVQIDLRGFVMPHKGAVTSGYGMRRSRWHYGTDLRVAVGDSIRSAWDGVVRIVGWDPRGYGRYVVVRHDNGLETVYGHLSMALYDENERIFAGEVLGLGGNTGRSTGPHLHFETRYLGNAFNTARLINYEQSCLHPTKDSIYILSQKDTWPERAELKAAKAAKYHTIRSGETLSSIARKYGTTVNALCRLNKINTKTPIRAGKKLRVR